jgi:hypothetical protein
VSSAEFKTPCCGYDTSKDGQGGRSQFVIMWNAFNRVVQCHNCGAQFKLVDQGDVETQDDCDD